MPISFTCPHCAVQTEVADQYVGQSGPCSSCGKIVTVPPPVGTPEYAPPSGNSWGPLILVATVVIGLVALFACGGMFFFLSWGPAFRSPSRQTNIQCTNNLRQIGLAMHSYADAHGCFPPAYVADEDGKPMYSWRVLLLPYLEETYLYEQFNLDEPWDSENNRALRNMMPNVFMCPADEDNDGSQTSYVMIVGPETFSDGPTGRKMVDMTDGLSNTIMIVETTDSGISWAEPQDLDAESITFGLDDGSVEGIRSNHADGCKILFGDGAVRTVNTEGTLDSSSQALHDMSTVSGGEYVDPNILGR